MSKRRNPFKKHFEDTKYGRYEVSERTGTPRYVTFNYPWGDRRPIYHVIKTIYVKVSQRPNRMVSSWFRSRAQWRWRQESIQTVCDPRRSNYLGSAQIHDRVSSQDRKCYLCFGNVPNVVLPKRISKWR